MRWWRRRREARYDGIRFEVVGGSLEPREWAAAGEAGPLQWSATMSRSAEDVSWRLHVRGLVTGDETRSGSAANAYAAADQCRHALREVIASFNALARED